MLLTKITKFKVLILSCLLFICISAEKSKKQHPLLTRYYVGFNISNPWMEEMMPGLSSISLVGVTAHILNAASKMVEGGGIGLGNSFVHIHPKHLALLLQFNGKLVSKSGHITKETFLDTFTRFFVPFGESIGEVIDYTSMAKLVKQVSFYNEKQEPAGTFSASKKLELWLSIPATENISHILYTVLDTLKNTNSVSSNAVSAILLNYRSLDLTAESVPLIHDDLTLAKFMITNMVGIGNVLKTGIVLEMHNCPNAFESTPLHSIKLGREDKLVFMPQLYSVTKDVDVASPTISCFFNGKFVQSKISLQVPIKIEISLENSTFTFMSTRESSLAIYASFSEASNRAHLLLKAEISELSKYENDKDFTKDGNIDETWLAQETVFDQTYFGVSVQLPRKVEAYPKVISKVFKHFLKIIVQGEGIRNVTQLKKFARSMAKYKATMVRVAMSKEQSNYGDTPAQLLITANIYHGDKIESWKSVKGAFEAAVLANEEYPGIASLMLNLDAFTNDKSVTIMERVVYGIGTGGRKYLTRVSSVALALFELKKELRAHSDKSDYMPKIGFISEYCWELTLAGTARILRTHFYDNVVMDSRKDLILLKVQVQKSDILIYGSVRAASDVIQAARNCDQMMLYFTNVQSFNLYVQLTGCSHQDDTNIYKLAEFVKFWEFLNSWAVKDKKTIFMGEGFQFPEILTSKTDIAKGTTNCGWWKVTTNSNVGNVSEWNWEDRKSIAVKLYGELNPVTRNQPFKNKTADGGNEHRNIMLAVFIPTSIFVAIIVSVSTVLILHYRSKFYLSKVEESNFIFGSPAVSAENGQVMHAGSGVTDSHSQPYNRAKYEIPHSSFQIDFTRCLGTGEFATVVCGAIKRENAWQKVAVKTTKKLELFEGSHSHQLALKGLISEIKILSYVGEHKHIMKMEGACTAKMRRGKLFVFVEMCELGSLDKYLRVYNPSLEEGQQGIQMRNFALSPEMTEDLRRWSIEIASGMEFLSSKKVVHADLSTRNILLGSDKCAKISDFGLSRRLYDYSEYLKKEAGPLPWRWMAPESLRRMIFNEKTDVWSFGVLLWEMYNLGDEPYPGLAWHVNFPSFLERGLRLSEPKYNQDDIYTLMKCCWEAAPSSRPKFSKLKELLQESAYVTVL